LRPHIGTLQEVMCLEISTRLTDEDVEVDMAPVGQVHPRVPTKPPRIDALSESWIRWDNRGGGSVLPA
jgi:hypothetical protein